MPSSAVPRRWLATSGLVGVAVGCASLLTLTYVLAVRTTRGRLLDGSSFRGAINNRTRLSDNIERLLDAISVTSFVAAAVVIALIALVRRRRELAVAAVVVLFGANLTSQVLKRYALKRPSVGFYETTPATLNSMPSGHTTVAFSVAVALVLVLPTRLRATAAWSGVIYATAVALATLSAGWHRPSDSVAAFLVVGCWALGAGAVAGAFRDGHRADTATAEDPRDTPRGLALSGVYLLAFGALVSAVILTSKLDSNGTSAQVLAYLAGGAAIAGAAAAVMSVLLAVMRWIAPVIVGTTPPEPNVGREF